jgi:hypothetical protein
MIETFAGKAIVLKIRALAIIRSKIGCGESRGMRRLNADGPQSAAGRCDPEWNSRILVSGKATLSPLDSPRL